MLFALSDGSVALLVATLSAIVAIASAVWQAVAESNRQQREHLVRAQEREEDRSIASDAVVRKFREPVLLAAEQLRARIENILDLDFMEKYGVERRDYVIDSTAFAFGELLCWMEILRQEQQFLDLGEEDASRNLSERLRRVGHVLSTDEITTTSGEEPAGFMLWRQEQRAIGEVMSLRRPEPLCAMGYAQFSDALQVPATRRWFERFRRSSSDPRRPAPGARGSSGCAPCSSSSSITRPGARRTPAQHLIAAVATSRPPPARLVVRQLRSSWRCWWQGAQRSWSSSTRVWPAVS
ncbi:MAG: hypothetical protein R2705_15480 [Ilumatobacteraceae bacterium]